MKMLVILLGVEEGLMVFIAHDVSFSLLRNSSSMFIAPQRGLANRPTKKLSCPSRFSSRGKCLHYFKMHEKIRG